MYICTETIEQPRKMENHNFVSTAIGKIFGLSGALGPEELLGRACLICVSRGEGFLPNDLKMIHYYDQIKFIYVEVLRKNGKFYVTGMEFHFSSGAIAETEDLIPFLYHENGKPFKIFIKKVPHPPLTFFTKEREEVLISLL